MPHWKKTGSVEGHSPYPTDADKYDLPLKVVNSSLSESDKNQIYYYIIKSLRVTFRAELLYIASAPASTRQLKVARDN